MERLNAQQVNNSLGSKIEDAVVSIDERKQKTKYQKGNYGRGGIGLLLGPQIALMTAVAFKAPWMALASIGFFGFGGACYRFWSVIDDHCSVVCSGALRQRERTIRTGSNRWVIHPAMRG